MQATRKKLIWFVEHVARELDLACLGKTLIEKARADVSVEIHHVYRDMDLALRGPAPDIVILPFFYRSSDTAITDYVRRWPNAIFFTLAFEQLLSPASAKTRIPSDDYTRQGVFHLAWGGFFRDFLMKGGVKSENIVVTGNPIYALYREPYSRFYPDKKTLAKAHGLDADKPWILFPEDQKYAFFADYHIRALVRIGADGKELEGLRDYSIRFLAELMRWCSHAAEKGYCVIVRPRPAVPQEALENFAKQYVPDLHSSIRFIKEGSARDWILNSDAVFSTYSTTLIEAAVAGKNILSPQPFESPAGYATEWHSLVPKLKSHDEFDQALRELQSRDQAKELRSWAEKTMLPQGDPIRVLIDQILKWVDGADQEIVSNRPRPVRKPMTLRGWVNRLRGTDRPFSSRHHEADDYSPEAISERLRRWETTLVKLSEND